MIIRITWKTVAAVAGVIAGGYLIYKGIKADAEEKKKLEEHKEEVLGDRDLDQEVEDHSINNARFTSDERAEAFEVLEDMVCAINSASTISKFDRALEDLEDALCDLENDEDPEAAKSCLKIYKARLDRKREKEKEDRREAIERSRNRTGSEIERATKDIAKALKSMGAKPSDLDVLLANTSAIAFK